MMIGEMTVHLGEDRMVLTRQQLHELLDHRAGGAVARVPPDPVRAARIADHQPVDIRVDDIRRRHLARRSEEHTSELQSLMRISYAVFCLKKKTTYQQTKQ